MKREIFKSKFSGLDFLKDDIPGEFVTVVHGTAKFDMICDWSGEEIKTGENVIAVSMGIRSGTKLVTWESNYLNGARH